MRVYNLKYEIPSLESISPFSRLFLPVSQSLDFKKVEGERYR